MGLYNFIHTLSLGLLLKPIAAHPEPWLLNYEVGIFLFLLNNLFGYVIVVDVVGAWRRIHIFPVETIPLHSFRFEGSITRSYLFALWFGGGVVEPRAHLILLRLLEPLLGRAKLSSVASLDLEYQSVFKCVTRFIGAWPWSK